jgi:hypothetical protein
MLELAMAAARRDQVPSVAPQDLQDLPNLHRPHAPLGHSTVDPQSG